MVILGYVASNFLFTTRYIATIFQTKYFFVYRLQIGRALLCPLLLIYGCSHAGYVNQYSLSDIHTYANIHIQIKGIMTIETIETDSSTSGKVIFSSIADIEYLTLFLHCSRYTCQYILLKF